MAAGIALAVVVASLLRAFGPETEAGDADGGRMSSPAESVAADRFMEGVHYRSLPIAARTVRAGGRTQVVQFFMYWCFPCYAFEPHFETWSDSRGEQIRVERVPVAWNARAQVHARAFYAAELLGVTGDWHAALFHAVHVEENPLDSYAALVELFARFGIGEAEFARAYGSAEVDARLERADRLARRFGVTGVPSLVIGGRYVTGGAMAESYEMLTEIADELVGRARACRMPAQAERCGF